jgi:DNA-binding NarL/FixJ family response regulator
MKVAAFRVAVIESQALFARALGAIFSEDPELMVVGEYRSPVAGSLAAAKPDLIVIDVDGQPDELSRTLLTCTEVPGRPHVCVLSIRSSPEVMQRCLAAGAAAYIVKDASPAEAIRAIKGVAKGQSTRRRRPASKAERERRPARYH